MSLDPETLAEVALELRERYPDDDDFEEAMQRLEDLLGQEGDATPPEQPPA